MARDRRSKEIETLNGVIRNQSKQIKHLKKELAKTQKSKKAMESLVENFTEQEPESTPEASSKLECPKCGKPTERIDLGKMGHIVKCNKCSYKNRIKLTK